LRQRCGNRRLAGARRAAKQDSLAGDAHRAGVQHDLAALVQQNAERGAENENRNVTGVAPGLRLERNLFAVTQQETRDAGNAQQKLFVRDLPSRAFGAGVFEHSGDRASPDGHVGRAPAEGQGNQAPQGNLARHR